MKEDRQKEKLKKEKKRQGENENTGVNHPVLAILRCSHELSPLPKQHQHQSDESIPKLTLYHVEVHTQIRWSQNPPAQVRCLC